MNGTVSSLTIVHVLRHVVGVHDISEQIGGRQRNRGTRQRGTGRDSV
jgi:hypothetical protein